MLVAAAPMLACAAWPAVALPAQPPIPERPPVVDELPQTQSPKQVPVDKPPQSEFLPVDDLPPGDQLPGAPLLITAYSFVLLALFGYVLSVARRLGTVQREVERLETDLKRSGRA
jgi:CcmD family protein